VRELSNTKSLGKKKPTHEKIGDSKRLHLHH